MRRGEERFESRGAAAVVREPLARRPVGRVRPRPVDQYRPIWVVFENVYPANRSMGWLELGSEPFTPQLGTHQNPHLPVRQGGGVVRPRRTSTIARLRTVAKNRQNG